MCAPPCPGEVLRDEYLDQRLLCSFYRFPRDGDDPRLHCGNSAGESPFVEE